MTKQSRIQAVEHVNLEAPPGIEEAIRWFYGEVALLREVTDAGDGSTMLRFKSERIELRVHVVVSPTIEAVDCRVTIAVPSLPEASDRLTERRVAFDRVSGITLTDRRLQVLDPAGNRVEFKQEWPQEVF